MGLMLCAFCAFNFYWYTVICFMDDIILAAECDSCCIAVMSSPNPS